jgi:biotin transporter BioY
MQLFLLAFIIGPFLFGFVFSRNKKQKVEQAEAIQQKKD